MAAPVAVKEVRRELRPLLREPIVRVFDDPFGLLRRFNEEVDQVFGEFGIKPRVSGAAAADAWSPDIEVFERGGQLIVRADLPGMVKDDVTVNVVDDMLTLQGERKQDVETKQDGYFRSERRYGAFFRSLPLPDGVKADQVQATFTNGVLEVVMPLPKAEEKTPKKIEVKVA